LTGVWRLAGGRPKALKSVATITAAEPATPGAEPPEFPRKLALDFLPTTGTVPVLNVFCGDVRVRLISAPDPGTLLQELAVEVQGVGPGMSLAAKVTNAQTYYAVPDAQAACAVLTDFTREVSAQRGKKIAPPGFLLQGGMIHPPGPGVGTAGRT